MKSLRGYGFNLTENEVFDFIRLRTSSRLVTSSCKSFCKTSLTQAWVKSAYADEIQADGLDEIKSVHISRRKADFITKWFHPTQVGFIPSERTDLVEKDSDCITIRVFFCVSTLILKCCDPRGSFSCKGGSFSTQRGSEFWPRGSQKSNLICLCN